MLYITYKFYMTAFHSCTPRRLKHIFSKFKPFFTKPQYENFCRTELGMMVAGKGEHKRAVHRQKNQSSLNRFITEPKWNVQAIVKEDRNLLLNEAELNSDVEYKVFDDIVYRKYSS